MTSAIPDDILKDGILGKCFESWWMIGKRNIYARGSCRGDHGRDISDITGLDANRVLMYSNFLLDALRNRQAYAYRYIQYMRLF